MCRQQLLQRPSILGRVDELPSIAFSLCKTTSKNRARTLLPHRPYSCPPSSSNASNRHRRCHCSAAAPISLSNPPRSLVPPSLASHGHRKLAQTSLGADPLLQQLLPCSPETTSACSLCPPWGAVRATAGHHRVGPCHVVCRHRPAVGLVGLPSPPCASNSWLSWCAREQQLPSTAMQ